MKYIIYNSNLLLYSIPSLQLIKKEAYIYGKQKPKVYAINNFLMKGFDSMN